MLERDKWRATKVARSLEDRKVKGAVLVEPVKEAAVGILELLEGKLWR